MRIFLVFKAVMKFCASEEVTSFEVYIFAVLFHAYMQRSICGPPPQLFAVAGDTSLSVPPQKAMTPSVSRQSRHGDEEKSLKSLKKESASSSHLSAVSDLISPRSVKNNDPDSLSQEVSSLPDTTGAEPLPAGPSVFYSDGLPKGPEFSAGLEEAETYYAGKHRELGDAVLACPLQSS